MIEKMNKYLFVVYHKEYEDFLIKLKELGVVHIKETKDKRKIDSLEAKLVERKEIGILYRKIKARRDKEKATKEVVIRPCDRDHLQQIVNEVTGLMAQEEELKNQVSSAQRELDYWKIWGKIDLSNLQKLQESGHPIHFFITPISRYSEEWEAKYNAVPICNFRGQCYFITIGLNGKELPEAEEIKAPTKSIEHLEEQVETFQKALSKVQSELESFANHRIGELKGILEFIDKEYAFSNALIQATDEAGNSVKVLEGWVPSLESVTFEEELQSFPIYLEKLVITEEDDVPIKLKNNAYSRLFEPITKMYSMPNYGEIDITGLFAPFFMLFFALCFGDGGYGLLVFILATVVKLRSSQQSTRDTCGMLQWLGGTATIVGGLMGTVFGMVMPWAGDDGVLGSVRDNYFLNQDNLMTLSIVLGFIQIIFGKFVAGVKRTRQKGIKYALSTFAWGAFILTAILGIVLQMKLPSLQEVYYTLFGIAGLCLLIALFYNSPDKNIFINFGKGLWDTYGTATGLLGDVLSYIRLFAIGLTGGILGGVFNSLAYQISEGLPWGVNFLVMAIILLLGHSLNIALCMISSLVHPLRLTFVEFYKNAEFEGGGKQYKPLD